MKYRIINYYDPTLEEHYTDKVDCSKRGAKTKTKIMEKVEIKPYLEENNPLGLLKKLGVTLEEVLAVKGDSSSTCTPKFPKLDSSTICMGVKCSECPFHTTMEDAIKWLSQK